MERIQIVFGIRIDGIGFPEISFSDTTPEYKNITLVPINSDKSLYEILVDKNISVAVGNELKNVIQEATTEAQTFVYVFSFIANIKIFEFSCKGYRQNNSLVSLEQIFGSTGIRISGQPSVIAGAESVNRVKESMKQNCDLSKLQLFFDSATITEPIGRFISLYTLMLHYCSDSQKEVDKAIVSIDSTVAQYKSPQGNWYETVFTKLRNELSHKRDGTNIIETHNQVRASVDRLEHIVRSHLLGTA
jgi:hypothetical protein